MPHPKALHNNSAAVIKIKHFFILRFSHRYGITDCEAGVVIGFYWIAWNMARAIDIKALLSLREQLCLAERIRMDRKH
jgi:hypothetical protein